MRGFMKGMGMGVMVGAALTMVMVPLDKKKIMKSNVGRTIRSVGSMMETLQDAF